MKIRTYIVTMVVRVDDSQTESASLGDLVQHMENQTSVDAEGTGVLSVQVEGMEVEGGS